MFQCHLSAMIKITILKCGSVWQPCKYCHEAVLPSEGVGKKLQSKQSHEIATHVTGSNNLCVDGVSRDYFSETTDFSNKDLGAVS